jgi:hypothetical protein
VSMTSCDCAIGAQLLPKCYFNVYMSASHSLMHVGHLQ